MFAKGTAYMCRRGQCTEVYDDDENADKDLAITPQ